MTLAQVEAGLAKLTGFSRPLAAFRYRRAPPP